MFQFVICFLIWTHITAVPFNGRIIGGEMATLGQFPYIVSIKEGPGIINHLCGGTIITEKWIVTTAHCVEDLIPEDIYLLADTVHLESGGTIHTVSSIIIHPEYYRYTYTNDIALIQLKNKFTLSSTTKTIEIGTAVGNESCTMTGWGKIRMEYPEDLHYANLTVLSDEDCTRLAQGGSFVVERGPGQICAFGGLGIGGCYGDSGVPLVCDDKLVGVASYAISPCAMGHPDVYTRVAYYVDWINDVISENGIY